MTDYVYIREYTGLASLLQGQQMPIPVEPGYDQTRLTITSSAAMSSAFQPNTAYVQIVADASAASYTVASASAFTAVVGFSGTGECTNTSTTLTVEAVTAGTIFTSLTGPAGYAGDVLAGTLQTDAFPSGTTFVKQLTGTAGGTGTYQMSNAATATESTATAFTTKSNVITTSSVTGYIQAGQEMSSLDVFITAQLSGTLGGAGNYEIGTQTAYTASTTYTAVASGDTIATTSSSYLPENVPLLFGITPGQNLVLTALTNS